MIAEIGLEIGMVGNEFPVIDERGIFAKAIRDFAVVIIKRSKLANSCRSMSLY